MTIFIIIIIVVLLIASGSKKSKPKSSRTYTTPTQRNYPKITVEIKRSSQNQSKSDSIIDITGNSYRLDSSIPKIPLRKVAQGVPYWQHHYVYSYSEINAATEEQKRFYKFLKESFLKGVYIELEGNTNYAFILFFDLLDEFLIHKDQSKIEHQLELLGQCYPKTSGYATQELIKRLGKLGETAAIQKLRDKQQSQYQYQDYDSWRLGTKYKSKLKLSENDVKLLNKVWQPTNNFGSIEYCCEQIVKLFLKTISDLNKTYSQEATTLDDQFSVVADLVARKHFNYRPNSTNYKYSLDQIKNELYSAVFKICENAVRESYDHKRKLSIDFYPNTNAVQLEFQSRVSSKVDAIHLKLSGTISPPDESTEIELNMQNTSRWKGKFDKITLDFSGDNKSFKERVEHLAAFNIKNPSIENIYFEASKFIAKTDKQTSLLFYIHYIYSDLQSAKFDNKQLAKTVQKSLFSSMEQLKEFENIIRDLIVTKNLDKAIEATSQFYIPKRKKIQLNSDAITQAHKKHSGTVELLNEYLKDEFEDVGNKISTNGVSNDEVQIAIKKEESSIANTKFSDIQQALLEYFQKNGLALAVRDIDDFARSRGLFRNQLIESINETCYETLDDLLIEEDGDGYSINPEYFQRILKL